MCVCVRERIKECDYIMFINLQVYRKKIKRAKRKLEEQKKEGEEGEEAESEDESDSELRYSNYS